MSKLSQYQTFMCVYEKKSITKAAAVLNLSVPAISKQLVQLEESLRVQLFHRSHKKLEISEAGKQFYPKCKSILLSISQAEEELLSEHDAMQGSISITLSKSLCRSKIFDALGSFVNTYPAIEFNIIFSDELEDLYARDIDFAFRLGRLNDSNTMLATPLFETQLVACATKNYLQKHGTPKSFSNLGASKFILISELNPAGELRSFLNKNNFNFTLGVSHTTNDIEGVYQLTIADLGIGLMLDVSIQRDLDNGRLVSILSEHKLPKKHLHLLSKKNQWQTKKQRVFEKHIKETFIDLNTDQAILE